MFCSFMLPWLQLVLAGNMLFDQDACKLEKK